MLGDRKLRFKDGTPVTASIANPDGSVTRLTQVSEWKPTAAEFASFAGEWYSEEARASFTFAIEGDKAFIKQVPVLKLPLQPLYQDHFGAPGYVLWVTRDTSGKIDKMHVGGSQNARHAVRAGAEIA